MAETAHIKYVFLDIAGFTKNRSVEAQSEIVRVLNESVLAAIDEVGVAVENIILLPTGDGIAIAIVESRLFDAHMQVGIGVLRRVAEHNQCTGDEMRRFAVRVGINENTDNLVTDVNNRRNVAGSGISMAQRVMDTADGAHLLVGHSVYEMLNVREKYMGQFRTFDATGKHGIQFKVHQYVADCVVGLSTGVPSAFASLEPPRPQLTPFAALFIVVAQLNSGSLQLRPASGARNYVALVLLYVLTKDLVAKITASKNDRPHCFTWGGEEGKSFDEQYEYYSKNNFWIMAWLADSIWSEHLDSFDECLELRIFPTETGLERLRAEQPKIAELLGPPDDGASGQRAG